MVCGKRLLLRHVDTFVDEKRDEKERQMPGGDAEPDVQGGLPFDGEEAYRPLGLYGQPELGGNVSIPLHHGLELAIGLTFPARIPRRFFYQHGKTQAEVFLEDADLAVSDAVHQVERPEVGDDQRSGNALDGFPEMMKTGLDAVLRSVLQLAPALSQAGDLEINLGQDDHPESQRGEGQENKHRGHEYGAPPRTIRGLPG